MCNREARATIAAIILICCDTGMGYEYENFSTHPHSSSTPGLETLEFASFQPAKNKFYTIHYTALDENHCPFSDDDTGRLLLRNPNFKLCNYVKGTYG